MNRIQTDLQIFGGHIALSANDRMPKDLLIQKGQIQYGIPRQRATPYLDMSGYLLLPGLINAHDHLEFGLFPRLGNGTYPNWQKWADDIYHPNDSPLCELLSIPKAIRLWFGGLRNLLCGVTTVAHHNPYLKEVFETDFPVHVVSEYGWAHSLEDPKDAERRFSQTTPDWPFLIHFAEGTDSETFLDFKRLTHHLPLSERLVLIHAVGTKEADLRVLESAGVSLVWCPSSNIFTLGRTLCPETTASYPFLSLGSDSPLTATGDLLDEMSFAYGTSRISPNLLYEMVTTRAATSLRLNPNHGSLALGTPANIIAIRDKGKSPAETLLSSTFENIECVLVNGQVMLLSTEFAPRVPLSLRSHLEEVQIGSIKRLLPAPVRSFIREVEHNGNGLCALEGRRILN